MAQAMRIFCKETDTVNVAIRGNAVVLAAANPADGLQRWIQDFNAVGNLTDEDGGRAFVLVNKATGQALVNNGAKRPSDDLVPVQLGAYNGRLGVPVSMVWTEGPVDAEGFREVKTLRDPLKVLNGLYGNVKDGTIVGVHPSVNGARNALWKIAPLYV